MILNKDTSVYGAYDVNATDLLWPAYQELCYQKSRKLINILRIGKPWRDNRTTETASCSEERKKRRGKQSRHYPFI